MSFSTFSSIGSLIKSTKSAAAPTYALTDIIDTTGLVYFYKFDTGDITNNKLYNYASGQNDMTQVGTLIQTSTKKLGTGASQGQPALTTLTNYGYITNSAVFNNSGFSISMWVYSSTAIASGTNQAFWQCHPSTVAVITDRATQVSPSTQELSIRGAYNGGAYTLNIFGATSLYTPTISSNAWHHIVVTRKNETVKIYIDNPENAGVSNPYVISTNPTMFLGGYSIFSVMYDYGGQTRMCYCPCDQLRIYNRELSAAEVTALYTET